MNSNQKQESKQKAQELKKQGRYTEALEIYNNIYEEGEGVKNTQILSQKSKVHHLLGQNKQAIHFLEQSIQLEETADKYCTLADYNNQNQDHTKAIKSYAKAVEIKQTSVQPETRQFLQNSIIIKQLPQIQAIIDQNDKIEAKIGEEMPNDIEELLGKANKSIKFVLKYNYNKDEEVAKQQNIQDLKQMMVQMLERINTLEYENKKIKGQQHGFYKNHELLFIQGLENSTLSPENQEVLKTYFTTFCHQMQLFFLTLKLLNKVPDAALTMEEIYTHSEGGEEALVQIQNKLKKLVQNLQKFKSAFENIPYVSIIFGIFKQFDTYFNKYVQKVHDKHKIGAITNSWMNSQVFNDFATDLASRVVNKMKLRILNYSQPSFKSYLKVLWSKLIKRYRYKSQAAKLKQLQTEQYNRKAYIAKLAERDAAIIFYAFEMQKLQRKGDMDQMADDVVGLISEFDGMKIDETLVAKQKEKAEEKKGYCLLF